MILRLGDQGEAVKRLQYKLKKVLNRNLVIDGDFGKITEKALKDFQQLADLTIDGIFGPNTSRKLDEMYKMMHEENTGMLHFGKKRFVVFVDAGHGGIDDSGKYTTAGKRAYHAGEQLHENGHYYEGYENRLIAEAFIEECTKAGIMCVRTYHPYKDTPLSDRTNAIRGWLKRGYYGYLHSFHSNAISTSNSADKLEKTRGFIVFNTRGDNFSDKIASQHFKHVEEKFKNKWKLRKQMKDGDEDYEANFQILRETDLREFGLFGAILDEWGFHTSKSDALFITKPENREKRVKCCVKTAKWVKKELKKRLEA